MKKTTEADTIPGITKVLKSLAGVVVPISIIWRKIAVTKILMENIYRIRAAEVNDLLT